MSFAFYKTITIDHTKVPATQTDFPVLVSFTDANLKVIGSGGHVQNSNGYDIGFYSDLALTTKLKWEIERYISTTGELVAWVKIASLSSSTNNVIYMAYGDASIASFQGDSVNVWDSSFVAVWHLPNGTSLTLADSSTNAISLTNTGSVAATTGQMGGGAVVVAGSTNSLNRTTASTPIATMLSGNKITISFWVKNTTTAQTNKYAFCIATPADGNSLPIIYGYAAGTYEVYLFSGGSRHNIKASVADNNWHRIDVAFDGAANTLRLYYDAVETYNAAETNNIDASGFTSLYIGASNTGFNNFGGSFDEVKVSSIARSANWITTEYNNQSSPATFYAVGTEFAVGSGMMILRPTGYGTYTEWDPGAGDNWGNVNDASDVSYNQVLLASVGYRDTFHITQMSFSSAIITNVTIKFRVLSVALGGSAAIYWRAISGAIGQGNGKTSVGSFSQFSEDVTDIQVWDVAKVNAFEIGYVCTKSTAAVEVSDVWLEVTYATGRIFSSSGDLSGIGGTGQMNWNPLS